MEGKGRYTLWIDPVHDYHIAKSHVQRKEGDCFNKRILKKNESGNEIFEVLRFQQIGDSWFPVRYKRKVRNISDGSLGEEDIIIDITVNSRPFGVLICRQHSRVKDIAFMDIEKFCPVKN